MKCFNVTGLCIPEKHYMVDINSKVKKIIEMVDRGDYFTINRPRQFGKTTTFNELIEELNKKYIVIDSSFEGIGDDLFETEEKFCNAVFEIFANNVRFTNKELYNKLKYYEDKTNNFKHLSNNITDIIEEYGKDMILVIDEVDKSSGNRIFMQFLGVLRNKYLLMNAGKDLTFKSVILGGVNDIKNIKLKIRDEKDRVFNSPWNIAADFKLDMEKLLLKFQEFMYSEYREEDEHFYETNGRLIFLAYLKPILNGKGFSFVEPQTRQNKRMDIVITYGSEKHIVELKICPDKKSAESNQDHFTSPKGIEQLSEYMKEQKVDKGYLLVFNFNKNKKYTKEWVYIKDKKIFEVML